MSDDTYLSTHDALGKYRSGPENGRAMRPGTCRLVLVAAMLACACREEPTARPAGEAIPAKSPEREPAPPGSVLSSDAARGNAELQARCEGDTVSSCLELGDRLREGWDRDPAPPGRRTVPVRLDAALAAYERGCAHAIADACSQLGFMYERGQQVTANSERAAELYERACNGASARGCSRLGALHLTGPMRDFARAHAFSETGCKGKDPLGCMNLGLMHQRGDGVAKDDRRASELFHNACQLGEGRGCTLLAERYAAGEGVERSPQLAVMFNQRGCALGDGRGCGNVGVSHQLGFGAKQDPERAAHYFERACKAGERRYCALLERFERGGAAP